MSIDPNQVIKAIRGAKEPISFGFGSGGAGVGVLVAERNKSLDQMIAAVKREPGVKQACGGTVVFDGRAAQFRSAKPLAGLERQITEWTKRNRISMKCSLVVGAADDQDEDEGENVGAIYQPPKIIQRLKIARTKPMFFAFGIGTSGPNLLSMHPMIEGEKLALKLKPVNGARKVAFGSVAVEDNLAAFNCEKQPFSGLKKALKALFKEGKIPFVIALNGPDGAIEDDEEEQEQEQEGQDGNQAMETVADAVMGLRPQLMELAKALPADADRLRSLFQDAQSLSKGNDLAAARKALAGLRSAQAEAASRAETLATASAELDALLPKLKEATGREPGEEAKARDRYKATKDAIAKGQVAAAREGLAALAAFLGQKRGAAGAPASDESMRAALVSGQRRLARVRADALKDIARLQGELRDQFPQEEFASRVKSADRDLERLKGYVGQSVEREIEAVLGQKALSARNIERVHAQANALLRFIESDSLMSVIDVGDLLPDVRISAPLAEALKAVTAIREV